MTLPGLLALAAALAQPAAAQLNLPVARAQNVAGTYTDLGPTGSEALAVKRVVLE